MKQLLTIIFLGLFAQVFSQNVIDEKVVIDTTEITYKVIHKETVGDYFQLKRYVFAEDTSVIAIEKNFSNGVQNGLTRIYYPSGKLRVKAIYGNNKLQGEWVNYGEDGVIITKGKYNYGIKHGYWAYKSVRTYGRYVKGQKHRNWVKKDKNKNKHKAWYWRGEFKRGADIFKEDYVTYEDTAFVAETVDTNGVTEEVVTINVDERILATTKYLAGNYYLRKATKDFFRKTKKERKQFVDENVDYDRDVFNFSVSSDMISADINWLFNPKIYIKEGLDSVRANHGEELKKYFAGLESSSNEELKKLSTKDDAKMIIYISEPKDNIIVVQLAEEISNESLKQTIILLLDNENKVQEALFQTRDW